MPHLHFPSVQHFSRNYQDDPRLICRDLIRLVKNPPTFSYNRMFTAARDMVLFGVPLETIRQSFSTIKNKRERELLLELLPLVYDHLKSIQFDYLVEQKERCYPAGRDLLIPFRPPMIYGCNGRLHLPWFSFWKAGPLDGRRLSLFVTIIYEILSQDPDLQDARFDILDFSSPGKGEPRRLVITDAQTVPRLPAEETAAMVETFVIGYNMALMELAKAPPPPPTPPSGGTDHPDLFDPS